MEVLTAELESRTDFFKKIGPDGPRCHQARCVSCEGATYRGYHSRTGRTSAYSRSLVTRPLWPYQAICLLSPKSNPDILLRCSFSKLTPTNPALTLPVDTFQQALLAVIKFLQIGPYQICAIETYGLGARFNGGNGRLNTSKLLSQGLTHSNPFSVTSLRPA